MTDKKIIINKMDVAECAYRRQNPHNFCMCASVKNENSNIIELTRYVQCEYNPDCYFKQLKRKEQECNNYKQALDEIENYVRDNSDFDKSDKLTSNTGAYDILEIINKAKGNK